MGSDAPLRHYIGAETLRADAKTLAVAINQLQDRRPLAPIPRGGWPVAAMLGEMTQREVIDLPVGDTRNGGPLRVYERNGPVIFVDDLVDSGTTMKRWKTVSGDAFATLYIKPGSPKPDFWVREIEKWIVFPWERNEPPAQDAVIRLLEAMGEDPNRDGLADTPRRVVDMLQELTTPKDYTFTTFPNDGDQMVVMRDIPFASLCEHHLLPFIGTVHVGYVPDENLAGLSKLARAVDHRARRLQTQERFTDGVADLLNAELQPSGVAVVVEAEHLCMSIRGVQKTGTRTITSALRGVMMDDAMARQEFYDTLERHR